MISSKTHMKDRTAGKRKMTLIAVSEEGVVG
jgi:hypothetical protein